MKSDKMQSKWDLFFLLSGDAYQSQEKLST